MHRRWCCRWCRNRLVRRWFGEVAERQLTIIGIPCPGHSRIRLKLNRLRVQVVDVAETKELRRYSKTVRFSRWTETKEVQSSGVWKSCSTVRYGAAGTGVRRGVWAPSDSIIKEQWAGMARPIWLASSHITTSLYYYIISKSSSKIRPSRTTGVRAKLIKRAASRSNTILHDGEHPSALLLPLIP